MTRQVPTIDHRRCLDEAFEPDESAPAVGVVDNATGRLKGLITSETVGEMLDGPLCHAQRLSLRETAEAGGQVEPDAQSYAQMMTMHGERCQLLVDAAQKQPRHAEIRLCRPTTTASTAFF